MSLTDRTSIESQIQDMVNDPAFAEVARLVLDDYRAAWETSAADAVEQRERIFLKQKVLVDVVAKFQEIAHRGLPVPETELEQAIELDVTRGYQVP